MKKFITLLAFFALSLAGAYELRFSDKNGENKISFEAVEIGQTNGVKFGGFNEINGQKAWQMNDFVSECEYDLAYKAREPEITDLDNDGVKEVWLIYYKACQGGLDPLEMKILAYEQKGEITDKYALRGQSLLEIDGGKYGGEFETDFAGANPAFLAHAKKLWNKYKKPFD